MFSCCRTSGGVFELLLSVWEEAEWIGYFHVQVSFLVTVIFFFFVEFGFGILDSGEVGF